jgi:hypothetical protein
VLPYNGKLLNSDIKRRGTYYRFEKSDDLLSGGNTDTGSITKFMAHLAAGKHSFATPYP